MKKLVILCLSLFLVCFSIISCGSEQVAVVLDAPTYSKISTEDLVKRLGEPTRKDEWTHETSKGNFQFITYDYTINGVYLNFITHENIVVKVDVTPNETVSYSDDYKYIFRQFGITPKSRITPVTNTENTLKFNDVADGIDGFDIYDHNSNDKTYGYVHITFDNQYFD